MALEGKGIAKEVALLPAHPQPVKQSSDSVYSRVSLRMLSSPSLGAGLSWEHTGQVGEREKGKDGKKHRIQRLLLTLEREVTVSPSNAEVMQYWDVVSNPKFEWGWRNDFTRPVL